MADLARLSMNTVTLRERWTLAQCIEGCARHGIPFIDPWRDKVAELGLNNAIRRFRDAGIRPSGVCRAGLFTTGDPIAIRDENRRAIDETAALGADCIVTVPGGLPAGSKDINAARALAADALAELVPYARAAGVTLALEPLHPMTAGDRSIWSTIDQVLDLCDDLGEGTGIALDVYHIWWDPNLAAGIARAAGRIAGYHVCDWKIPTIDTVFDRGMMGDGVIDIPAITAMVDAAGYTGPIAVEIFSAHDWWKRDPEDVLRVAKERFTAGV
jgi:sugar phosphate isomerase/epimerase